MSAWEEALPRMAVGDKWEVYAPSELMPGDQLHIIQRGVAMREGRVLMTGMVWGDDMILETHHLRHEVAVRALTFMQVQLLRKRELEAIASQYPAMQAQIRRLAIRVALRRECLRDVLLDAIARVASLVEPIEQQQSAPLREGAPKHLAALGVRAQRDLRATRDSQHAQMTLAR